MRIPISALVLAMALVTTTAALAQQSPPAMPHQQMRGPMGNDRGAGPGMMPMMGMQDPTRHVEGRLAFINAELAITEAQQPQWQAFAAAFRANAKRMGEMHLARAAATPMPGAMPDSGMMKAEHSATSLPERFEQAERHMTMHLEMLRSMKEPVTQLYGALSADQKKMADEIIRGPMSMNHRM